MKIRDRAWCKKHRGKPGRQRVLLQLIKVHSSDSVTVVHDHPATIGVEKIRFSRLKNDGSQNAVFCSDPEQMWDARKAALKLMAKGWKLVVVRVAGNCEVDENSLRSTGGVYHYSVGSKERWLVLVMEPNSVASFDDNQTGSYSIRLSGRGRVSYDPIGKVDCVTEAA